MEGKLKGVMKEIEEELNKEEKRKVGWWDEVFREKREARRELRRWRRKGGKGEKYKRRKQEFRDMREEKEGGE